jgi:transposase
MKSRRKFTAEFKAKVAIDAIKEQESLKELGIRYQIHPNLIAKWKKEFLQNASSVFKSGSDAKNAGDEVEKQKLYEVIGHQKVQIDFLKKALS